MIEELFSHPRLQVTKESKDDLKVDVSSFKFQYDFFIHSYLNGDLPLS
jgi:hypothetical protein